jgi:hypothetical protein
MIKNEKQLIKVSILVYSMEKKLIYDLLMMIEKLLMKI